MQVLPCHSHHITTPRIICTCFGELNDGDNQWELKFNKNQSNSVYRTKSTCLFEVSTTPPNSGAAEWNPFFICGQLVLMPHAQPVTDVTSVAMKLNSKTWRLSHTHNNTHSWWLDYPVRLHQQCCSVPKLHCLKKTSLTFLTVIWKTTTRFL